MGEYTHTFYFDGVDCESLGLHYAPEINGNQTYVWNPSASKVLEQQFESHDGGYYYGQSVQPKEFSLRCYYEQTPQEEGLMYKVFRFFRKGRRGKLVFERRAWVYYDVVITNVDIGTMYNFQNGLVTIYCKAYEPYGKLNFSQRIEQVRCMYNPYDETTQAWDYNVCKENSELWDDLIPYPNDRYKYYSTTTDTSGVSHHYLTVYMFNPGDLRTPLKVLIRDRNIKKVRNYTNNSTIELNPFDNSIPNSNYLCIDGENGKCYYGTKDSNSDIAVPISGFKYHKRGFLYAEPNKHLKRTFTIAQITQSSGLMMTVKLNRKFDDDELRIMANMEFSSEVPTIDLGTEQQHNYVPGINFQSSNYSTGIWASVCRNTSTNVRLAPIVACYNVTENDVTDGYLVMSNADTALFTVNKRMVFCSVNPILFEYDDGVSTANHYVDIVMNPRFN